MGNIYLKQNSVAIWKWLVEFSIAYLTSETKAVNDEEGHTDGEFTLRFGREVSHTTLK